MIRDGYLTTALVGGAEAPVTPLIMAGFASMRALSRRNDDPAGACRPFDAERCAADVSDETVGAQLGMVLADEVTGTGSAHPSC